MRKHLNLKIYGRVIGVGFRWAAKQKADELGIKGFIRNVEGNHLELEAEGEAGQADKFLAWCRKGPFWAKVERVEMEEGEEKGYDDFVVQR